MPSSTSNSLPSGLAKALRTSVTCSNGAVFIEWSQRSSESELAFCVVVQRSPEQAIDGKNKYAHGGDAEHDAMKITGGSGISNVSAESMCSDLFSAPARNLGNDSGIP